MEKKITCIICPRGCPMTAVIEGDTVKVTGHSCPKGAMADVMVALRRITVQAPIHIGDVVLEDVFGTKVIATKEVL